MHSKRRFEAISIDQQYESFLLAASNAAKTKNMRTSRHVTITLCQITMYGTGPRPRPIISLATKCHTHAQYHAVALETRKNHSSEDWEEMASQEMDDQRTVTESLPGYLPWEEDLEMVSKYLDRKVICCPGRNYQCVSYPHSQALLFICSSNVIWEWDQALEFLKLFNFRMNYRSHIDSTWKSTLLWRLFWQISCKLCWYRNRMMCTSLHETFLLLSLPTLPPLPPIPLKELTQNHEHTIKKKVSDFGMLYFSL